MSEDRLKNNIRYLRLAYGETQGSLGTTLNFEKNTISSYENDIRNPNKDTLKKIADYFMITVDDLLYKDFSYLGKINWGSQLLWTEIDELLPIFSSENALKNSSFKKAFNAHNSLYEKAKKNKYDDFELLAYGIDCYSEAINDPNAQIESAANYLSILFLVIFIVKGIMITSHPTAAIKQLRKNDRKIGNMLDCCDNSFYEKLQDLLTQVYQSDYYNQRTELLFLLKKDNDWSDLADYYLALQYYWGILDNEFGLALNQKIGYEMMISFSSVGNNYANRYLQFVSDAQSADSSRFVNDKKKKT